MNDEAQVMANLQFAIAVRARHKEFKDHTRALSLEAGRARLARLLVEDEPLDDAVARMRVDRFLGAIYRFGPSKITSALVAAGIVSGDRRVRDLTNRQRVALAVVLDPSIAYERAAA